MTYYCFFCNETHEDSLTEEHFIPRSIHGPEYQFLPVCAASNARSNDVFDNDARDLLYWIRFKNTGALKRLGEVLLSDGSIKQFRFSYHENTESEEHNAFRYIYDRDTNSSVPSNDVYAIKVPVGLNQIDKQKYCRGLAKMTLGSLAFLLKDCETDEQIIRQIFAQDSIDAIRHFALDQQWTGDTHEIRFSLGRSDILKSLQRDCKNSQVRNHVIRLHFQEDNSIQVEGMLYSQYGWAIKLSNNVPIRNRELRLENEISNMNLTGDLRDLTMSLDSICIVNPDYDAEIPNIPQHWKNQ